jgi:hypothetical protein
VLASTTERATFEAPLVILLDAPADEDDARARRSRLIRNPAVLGRVTNCT